METKDFLSETFGYILGAVAIGLAIWQHRTFSRQETEPWLRTKRRYRRRMFISFIMLLLGITMVLEASKELPTSRPGVFVVYVSIMMVLSLLLVLLAAADVLETANSAAAQSLRELEAAVEKEKLRAAIAAAEEKPREMNKE